MQPPVDFQDRSDYKRRMNALLEIDPQKTVVLTVDMQNDYLDMQLATAPVAPDEAKRVLTHTRRLLAFARAARLPVVHAYVKRRRLEVERKVVHNAVVEASQLARLSQNVQAPARTEPDRVEGMPQAEVPAELVAPGDFHMTAKRVLDAFHGTDLDMLLSRVLGARTLIVAGINTDTCVYATVFAAGNRGYQPVVISDCVASMRGLDQHWMALELMSRSVAWVMTVDEIKAKLDGATRADPTLDLRPETRRRTTRMSDIQPNRGRQDIGGDEAGPVDTIDHGMKFWERQANGLRSVLSKKQIVRTDELRRAAEDLPNYSKLEYFEITTSALRTLLLEKGLISESELKARMDEVARASTCPTKWNRR